MRYCCKQEELEWDSKKRLENNKRYNPLAEVRPIRKVLPFIAPPLPSWGVYMRSYLGFWRQSNVSSPQSPAPGNRLGASPKRLPNPKGSRYKESCILATLPIPWMKNFFDKLDKNNYKTGRSGAGRRNALLEEHWHQLLPFGPTQVRKKHPGEKFGLTQMKGMR